MASQDNSPLSPAGIMGLRTARGETIELPHNLTLLETAEQLTLTWHWRKISSATIIFGVVCALLGAWMTAAASGKNGVLMALMFAPHLLMALTWRHGRVVVQVDRSGLTTAKVLGNLRWAARSVATANITQLFVVQDTRLERGRTVPVVRLKARRNKGEDVIVVDGMDTLEQGKAMERVLEQRLGIVDQPVA